MCTAGTASQSLYHAERLFYEVLGWGYVLPLPALRLLSLSRRFAELAAICCTCFVACHLGGTAVNTPAQAVLLRQHFRAILRGEQCTRS